MVRMTRSSLNWISVTPGECLVANMNGHRLAVQRAEIGSRRWWSFVDGDPIGGSHPTAEKAQQECERLAQT